MTFSCTRVSQTQEASPFIGSPSNYFCLFFVIFFVFFFCFRRGNSCKLNGTLTFLCSPKHVRANSFLNVTLEQ